MSAAGELRPKEEKSMTERTRQAILATLLMALCSASVRAQGFDANFPDRKALIVNICPHVELSGFSFQNRYVDRQIRFETNMAWTNIGSQPLVAFEIVILKYDAFNRRLVGERWTVTGTNSANWKPLWPTNSSQDGTISYGSEEVFTAIAYVRTARLDDGTVWEVNDSQLLSELRRVVPGLKDFGEVKPDPKVKSKP